jgi:predicted CXXCH cytochrome family protein
VKRVFLILMAGIVWAGDAYSAQKHECSYCHVISPATTPQQLKAPLAELCVGCHADRRGPNEHKVDIVPSMKVVGLPLSREGKITCATCHDPHGTAGHPRLLRARGEELCVKCHFR